MSGPYHIQQEYFGDSRWWVLLGPTLKPAKDKNCLTFTANARGMLEAEWTRDALNAAHAAGVAAERKRVVAQLRSRLDGGITAVDVYMQLAAELEKEQP